ncbi:similar to Saccharomyces cerevisiae YDR524C-B Putative protein of unknown function [Geotrichum candidum]|uniref:Uncharacterized protein n=2 Tax=Geotrichum TaxID=43987 RepID=A0A0J9XH09_GEOCN|nr:similar to Saccharomyces cerevisiae YDR524C-B Putative protein of unknown function [Geotrichum candidum]
MQFQTIILAAFAATALAQNKTNGTNGTTTAAPTGAETANSANHIVNAGLFGAAVAGGVALIL